ncbi:hypothetical protein GH714_024051 [Hevea brasiliensis]|uniref:RNase H type-1 domain-containing protein n=1 Tax=Hevea brasiliensis TaxID=3981 RepID=A0A6A6M169_HEVBR|nr:hypothetical protein GH714_024051 [Hevea brasiliensis]
MVIVESSLEASSWCFDFSLYGLVFAQVAVLGWATLVVDNGQAMEEDGDGCSVKRLYSPSMDAVIFSNDAKSSYGASIRDSNGHFVLSITSFFEVVHCPHMAKATGLREVLLWLGSCNWWSVDIEIDSKMFADAINSVEYDFSKFG